MTVRIGITGAAGRMGRLLAPFYTYIYFADPAVGNFYKRLVRDVVRVDEPRVTCVAAGIVEWLGRNYVSVHARRNELQFVEAKPTPPPPLLLSIFPLPPLPFSVLPLDLFLVLY